jgi:transcriptional regulator with XRE-family HTH domain
MKVNLAKVERRMAELQILKKVLAERMNVWPGAVNQTLKRIEQGLEIKPATVANLARGLDCSLDDLLEPLPSPRRNGQRKPKAAAAGKAAA